MTDDRMKAVGDAGGVALAATGASGGFRASIVAMPVPGLEGDLTDQAVCARVAQASMAAISGVDVVREQIVAAPWGATCQFEVKEKDRADRGAVGTVVYKGTSSWLITCNLDPQDGRARVACDDVVRSWDFVTAG